MNQVAKDYKDNAQAKLLLFIPVLLLLIIQLCIFSKAEFPLTGDDNSVHYFFINEIITTSRLNLSAFYPFGMHLIVSIFYFLTRIPVPYLLTGLTIMIVSLAPLSFYYLTQKLTHDKKQALIVALFTPLVYILPLRVYPWGGYPFLWGLTLLWFYVGFTIQALEKARFWPILLSVLLGLALFLIHSPEFVTASIFLGIYFIINLRKHYKQLMTYFWVAGNIVVYIFLYFFLIS